MYVPPGPALKPLYPPYYAPSERKEYPCPACVPQAPYEACYIVEVVSEPMIRDTPEAEPYIKRGMADALGRCVFEAGKFIRFTNGKLGQWGRPSPYFYPHDAVEWKAELAVVPADHLNAVKIAILMHKLEALGEAIEKVEKALEAAAARIGAKGDVVALSSDTSLRALHGLRQTWERELRELKTNADDRKA